eukprot:scaffold195951_cov22-Tisochrysis_lutea.AAC.1
MHGLPSEKRFLCTHFPLKRGSGSGVVSAKATELTFNCSQGTVAYLSGDFTAAAQHFTTAHARAQSVAGCSCNPLAARNAAASLNNWGAAVAMLGEKWVCLV